MPNVLFHLQFPDLPHAEKHLPNATDPLALPADITSGQALGWDGTKYKGYTAGGISTPYDTPGLYYDTAFDSLDGLTQYTFQTGAITIAGGYVKLQSGATSGSIARITKLPYYPRITPTWAKQRRIKTRARFINPAGSGEALKIFTGNYDTPIGFGFLVSTNGIYGRTGNGSLSRVLLLETIPAGAYDITRNLEAIFTPGSKVQFFVNGVNLGEITDRLPTGTESATYVLWIENLNTAAQNNELHTSQFSLYQEP